MVDVPLVANRAFPASVRFGFRSSTTNNAAETAAVVFRKQITRVSPASVPNPLARLAAIRTQLHVVFVVFGHHTRRAWASPVVPRRPSVSARSYAVIELAKRRNRVVLVHGVEDID